MGTPRPPASLSTIPRCERDSGFLFLPAFDVRFRRDPFRFRGVSVSILGSANVGRISPVFGRRRRKDSFPLSRAMQDRGQFLHYGPGHTRVTDMSESPGQTGGNKGTRLATCRLCLAEFEASNNGPLPHHCSKGCKERAKKGLPPRPKTVPCEKCGTDIPVKPIGRYPKWCQNCNPKTARITGRTIRVAAEAALMSYPNDVECRGCHKPVRGSGEEDKTRRWKAHVIHFELYHHAASRRRDAARLERARRICTGRIDENLREIDILRRDNYTCQMCGRTIILNERPRRWNGPSIDHIEWLSSGGDHTMENVQAAHLGCNIQEGYRFHEARTTKSARQRRSEAAKRGHRTRRKREDREMLIQGCLTIVVAVGLLFLYLFMNSVGTP